MTENENNSGMTRSAGSNESPLPDGGTGSSEAIMTEPEESLSQEQLSELKNRAAKADENWDKYVRTVADFDNFKKRAARERTEAIRYANESLIEKLLPIIDNFEAALAAASAAPGGNIDSLKTGISMIYSQLKSFLSDSGVEEIDALNKPFDPNFHEAVSQQASAEAPEGQVLQQMRKGYRLRDRLIRPAMVVVAKKP
jgi:molecular chaperone GrpE